jgi:hypothetical protein
MLKSLSSLKSDIVNIFPFGFNVRTILIIKIPSLVMMFVKQLMKTFFLKTEINSPPLPRFIRIKRNKLLLLKANR